MTAGDEAEQFLARLTAIQGVTGALLPFVELIASIKQTFVNGGFSEDAAEALTIEFTRAAIMPYVGPRPDDEKEEET